MDKLDKKTIIDKCLRYVDKYLEYCDEASTPFVCALKSEKGGVDKIKKFVLNRAIQTGFPVGKCIMDMERTLNPEYVDF
mgnify:CR=1 FL=1|jgi:hypothetical protein